MLVPGGGGVLLEICGGGVPPGSPNSDPISDQNMPFSIPVFRPDIYVYKGLNCVIIASVRTPTTDLLKFSSNDLFWLFLFLSDSFEVEKTNTFIRSCGSLENHIRFQTIMVKIYTRFQTKTAQKPYPLEVAHTYIADIGEYSPRVLVVLKSRGEDKNNLGVHTYFTPFS